MPEPVPAASAQCGPPPSACAAAARAGHPASGLPAYDAARFSVLPHTVTHLPMTAGIGVLSRRLAHPPGALTEIAVPAASEHVLLLLAGRRGGRYLGRIGRERLAFDAEPDLAILLPAGTASEWRIDSEGDEALHLHLDPDWLAALARREGLGAPGALAPRLLRADPWLVPLHRMVDTMLAGDGARADRLFLAHWAALVATRILRLPRPARGGALGAVAIAPHRMAAVRSHVAAKLGEPIPLSDLAALAGLSRAHFSRAFRQETGLAPCAWVLRQRLAEARRLMRETDLPDAEVARMVGLETLHRLRANLRRNAGEVPDRARGREADG